MNLSVNAKKRFQTHDYKKLGRNIYRDRWLYAMFLPVLVYFIIFKYVPMLGTVIAFKDY